MGPGQASAEKDGETIVEKALVLYDALDDAFREAGVVRAMAPGRSQLPFFAVSLQRLQGGAACGRNHRFRGWPRR